MSEQTARRSNERIVVGIDGSPSSQDALRWAARQAELTGARLEVVLTWHVPPAAYGAPVMSPTGFDFEPQARRTLDQTIHDVMGEHPTVDVSGVVIEGLPAPELLQRSNDAELLVVGSRGHGAFAGMLLGSVSEHCVAHASCPVVVVRHTSQPA